MSTPDLVCVWPNGAAFLERFDAEGPGSFWYPVAADRDLPPHARLGQLLRLTMKFSSGDIQGELPEFHLHARVVERVAEGQDKGIRLELLAEENARRELLIAYAEGQSIPFFRRRHSRYRCHLELTAFTEDGRELAVVGYNISEGGISVRSATLLSADQIVELSIPEPVSGKNIAVSGRVRSVITGGPDKGFGVEFLVETPDLRDRVAQLVAVAKQS